MERRYKQDTCRCNGKDCERLFTYRKAISRKIAKSLERYTIATFEKTMPLQNEGEYYHPIHVILFSLQLQAVLEATCTEHSFEIIYFGDDFKTLYLNLCFFFVYS